MRGEDEGEPVAEVLDGLVGVDVREAGFGDHGRYLVVGVVAGVVFGELSV